MMPSYIYNMGSRFKAIAIANSARIALHFADNDTLSYAELDAASDRAAAHLLASGVKQRDVVAIFAEKSALTYIAMIACLKIGAPYVVLDTASPLERLDKILKCCQPKILLTDRDCEWKGAKQLSLAALSKSGAPLEPHVVESVIGSTPAYLMFTSGSTGFPKGVTISHASMLNFCDWVKSTFSITPEDRFTAANALYFDNSVFDFSASLFNGASLVPIDRETVTQPKKLAERASQCTIWFSVPSLLIYLTTLRALSKDSWPHMRAIIFGGEGYAKMELKKLHGMLGDRATLWNVYGPTECTCICSAYAISERDFEAMDKLAPLGHMAPNFGAHVMDETGTKEMPAGEAGELFLTGPQVALGYYNDPERTRAAFAPNPLSATAEACYRTGDLVVKDKETGFYHFVGRKDNQIKHMGYRVELEEIESALNGMDEVAQAAVIYHKKASHGGAIVAFVSSNVSPAPDVLIERLRGLLPHYMIPEALFVKDSLPKNANGKVDRKALAAQYGEQHG